MTLRCEMLSSIRKCIVASTRNYRRDSMQPSHIDITERFLADLVEGGDFTSIPMSEQLRFRGPLATADTAQEYRAICRGFADTVRSLELREWVGTHDVVHMVYDVDLGLASGPLATSQTIRFEDGKMLEVEVIFDAARATGWAS